MDNKGTILVYIVIFICLCIALRTCCRINESAEEFREMILIQEEEEKQAILEFAEAIRLLSEETYTLVIDGMIVDKGTYHPEGFPRATYQTNA